MRPRVVLGLAIPLLLAALFIRLGVWQLARHGERSRANEELIARLAAPVLPFDELPADTGAMRWRRVALTGRFRYDLEQAQGPRANQGSPGVHLLTPLERPGRESLVVVTRGWVYSPDAKSADLARWRERQDEEVALTGYVVPLPPTVPSTTLGRPVARAMVVMTSDSVARIDSVPRRLTLPTVEQGPHLAYALQWFAFATIALVGGVLLTRRSIVRGRALG